MSSLHLNDIVSYFTNSKCVYYSHKEILYAGTFPKLWAKNHKDGTGPKNCRKCDYIGLWNGVFIGYCVKCAINIYKGERGRGLIDIGVENKKDNALKYPSIFNTYLNNVKQEDIGDIRFVDSASIVKERQQLTLNRTNTIIQPITRYNPIKISTPIIPIYTHCLTNEILNIDNQNGNNNMDTDIIFDPNEDTYSDDSTDTISSIETDSDDDIDIDN